MAATVDPSNVHAEAFAPTAKHTQKQIDEKPHDHDPKVLRSLREAGCGCHFTILLSLRHGFAAVRILWDWQRAGLIRFLEDSETLLREAQRNGRLYPGVDYRTFKFELKQILPPADIEPFACCIQYLQ